MTEGEKPDQTVEARKSLDNNELSEVALTTLREQSRKNLIELQRRIKDHEIDPAPLIGIHIVDLVRNRKPITKRYAGNRAIVLSKPELEMLEKHSATRGTLSFLSTFTGEREWLDRGSYLWFGEEDRFILYPEDLDDE